MPTNLIGLSHTLHRSFAIANSRRLARSRCRFGVSLLVRADAAITMPLTPVAA